MRSKLLIIYSSFFISFSGCQGTFEENIIGKWEFVDPGYGKRPELIFRIGKGEELFATVTSYEFFRDKTVIIHANDKKQSTTYKFTHDGKYLEIKLEDRYEEWKLLFEGKKKMSWVSRKDNLSIDSLILKKVIEK